MQQWWGVGRSIKVVLSTCGCGGSMPDRGRVGVHKNGPLTTSDSLYGFTLLEIVLSLSDSGEVKSLGKGGEIQACR